MRGSTTRVLVAVTAALALMASGCSDDDNKADDSSTTAPAADRGNVDGVLKFGTLTPQTGDLAAIGESISSPIRMAVDEINAAGGVNGKPVEVVEGDDGNSATVAQTTYGKEVNTDKVDAILGPSPSGVAAKIAETLGTDRVPACSGSTTAANLTGVGDGYFFRTAPPDSLQGPALANLILADNHQKVAILARNDDYGKGFSEALGAALDDNGATVSKTVLYDPAGASFDADVQQAVDSTPEAIVVLGFNDDGAKIINTMIGKGAGPKDIPVYTADGMQGSKFAGTVDSADPSKVAGIKGTAPAGSPVGMQHPFQAKFAATGVDPIFSAYFYDCTNLIALAAQAAGSDDGTKIRDAFAKNLEGDTDCQTFAECKAALDKGETIHYRGASSAFDQWNKTEPKTGAYEIWSYDAAGKVKTEAADKQIKIS